jgi:TPR repeat protein
MKRFNWKAMILGARPLSGVCSLVALAALSAPPVIRAQQKGDSTLTTCVPSDLATLIVPDGHTIRVEPVQELAGHGRSHLGDAAAVNDTPDPAAARARKEAFGIFEKEARHGYSHAQVNLAVSYLSGWGTQPNAGAGLYWLHAAADQGYAPAFYDLGILYFKGCGVRQDYGEALLFFEQGARRGDAPAEVNLGFMYDHGLGVTQDHAAAFSWYRKAAERGEPLAQYNLADLYLHGEGVSPDDAAAFGWLQKAALQGHTGACIMLGSMFAAGRGTPKDLPAAYLWISAAALEGDTRGNATLRALEGQLTPSELTQATMRAQSLAQAAKRRAELALLH